MMLVRSGGEVELSWANTLVAETSLSFGESLGGLPDGGWTKVVLSGGVGLPPSRLALPFRSAAAEWEAAECPGAESRCH